MCNIAGYVGEREAAPILIEMIRAQEGFLGGYFTGLATVDGGRIHYAKLTGDADRLVALTEAARLPGRIGIIHSRSNAGGGDEWAHPFVGVRGGESEIAYVANGALGFFKDLLPQFCKIADGLHAQGYKMDSRVAVESDRYPKMADGLGVHMSDVMCQLILKRMDDGIELPRAMSVAFADMPSEIVGLTLSRTQPDRICFARINMPMFVAYAPHGAYLSSTPIAMPADAGAAQLLPPQSFGTVTAKGYDVRNMPHVADIAPIDAALTAEVYAAIRKALGERAHTMTELVRDVAKPLFARAECRPGAALCYAILHAMLQRGDIRVETVRVPGAREGLAAPKCVISLA